MKALFTGTDLTGMVITGDAAHAQHATAAYLTAQRGGHYALTVKGNQPTPLAHPGAATGCAGHRTSRHRGPFEGPDRAPRVLDRPR